MLSALFHGLVIVSAIVFWLTAFSVFYHLVRFGIGLLPKRLAALFFAGAIIFFMICTVFYLRVDLSSLTGLKA